MVIVDESDYIKGHRAKRTARITLLSEQARYRLVLTGTPISQGIQDLFSQMKFLSPKILGYRSWHTFARNHLEYSDRYRGLVVRTHNTEWLAEKIRPYVYQVTKEECLTLPEKLYESRRCTLTSEQEQAYAIAKDQFVKDMIEYWDDSAYESSVPIFRLFSRLQGIVCGFARDSDGNASSLHHLRLGLLLDTLKRIPPGEKVVIWAKYHHCIDEIVAALPTEEVCQYHGHLSERRRHDELQRWRESGRYLVGTQSAGQRGVDMTAANHVIFYANSFKYSERLQAEDRAHRIGQTKPVTYIDLWAECGIEERIAGAMWRKGNVVDDFKAEVDKIKDKHNRKTLLKKLVKKL
jgi:SNF2 family DNA or RNA helicase